jgi:hypothetical protein
MLPEKPSRFKLKFTQKVFFMIQNMMNHKKISSDAIVKKLMDIWKGDPVNSFKSLLKRIDDDYIETIANFRSLHLQI